MASKVKISIPAPCHENWQDMTPADKGRFCASCQKVVLDLTDLSDREIAAMVQKNNQLCGHARKNQLDRNLVVPSEKSNAWIAAGAAVVSLLTIGNNAVTAQTPVKTEQTETKTDDIKDRVSEGKRIITGTVSDESGPVADALIRIVGKPQTAISDIDGKFEIEAVTGDRLFCYYLSNNDVTIIDGKNDYAIKIEYEEVSEGIIITSYKRTFFGRIFHAIGNLFR